MATLQDPTMADEESSRDGAVKKQAVARAGDDGAWPVCSDTHVAAGLQRGWTSWEVLAGIAVPGRASPCRREARAAGIAVPGRFVCAASRPVAAYVEMGSR